MMEEAETGGDDPRCEPGPGQSGDSKHNERWKGTERKSESGGRLGMLFALDLLALPESVPHSESKEGKAVPTETGDEPENRGEEKKSKLQEIEERESSLAEEHFAPADSRFSYSVRALLRQKATMRAHSSDWVVAAWNVNGLRNIWKRRGLIPFILRVYPNVLILTELKSRADRLFRLRSLMDGLHQLGYHLKLWHTCEKPSTGYSGTAVFCLPGAEPFHAWSGVGDEKVDEEGRVMTLLYPAFTLVGTYVTCSGIGPSNDQKREYFDSAFLKHVQKVQKDRPTVPVLVMGDLNVARRVSDVFDGSSNPKRQNWGGFKPQERSRFETFLKTTGLVDTIEHFNPDLHKDPERFTFYFTRRNHWRNAGWRLDYVLADPRLLKPEDSSGVVLDSSWVDRASGFSSDHLPVVCQLRGVLAVPLVSLPPPPETEEACLRVALTPNCLPFWKYRLGLFDVSTSWPPFLFGFPLKWVPKHVPVVVRVGRAEGNSSCASRDRCQDFVKTCGYLQKPSEDVPAGCVLWACSSEDVPWAASELRRLSKEHRDRTGKDLLWALFSEAKALDGEGLLRPSVGGHGSGVNAAHAPGGCGKASTLVSMSVVVMLHRASPSSSPYCGVWSCHGFSDAHQPTRKVLFANLPPFKSRSCLGQPLMYTGQLESKLGSSLQVDTLVPSNVDGSVVAASVACIGSSSGDAMEIEPAITAGSNLHDPSGSDDVSGTMPELMSESSKVKDQCCPDFYGDACRCFGRVIRTLSSLTILQKLLSGHDTLQPSVLKRLREHSVKGALFTRILSRLSAVLFPGSVLAGDSDKVSLCSNRCREVEQATSAEVFNALEECRSDREETRSPSPSGRVRPGLTLSTASRNRLDLVNVPLAMVGLEGISSRVLIDSGASYNIATEEALRRVLGDKEYGRRINSSFQGMGLQFEGVKGSISAKASIKMKVQFGKGAHAFVAREEVFWVVSSALPVPVILGGGLLLRHGFCLDYDRKLLTWSKGKRGVSFQIRPGQSYRQLVLQPYGLRVSSPTVVPPLSCKLVQCKVTVESVENGQWRCVNPNARGVGTNEPSGFCEGQALGARGIAHVEDGQTLFLIMNTSADDLRLLSGVRVGQFVPLDAKGLQYFEIDLEKDFNCNESSCSDRNPADSCGSGGDASVPCGVAVDSGVDHGIGPSNEDLPPDLSLSLTDMNITAEQLDDLKRLLRSKKAAFSQQSGRPGLAVGGYEMRIETGSADPIALPPRRHSPSEREYIIKTVKEMLDAAVIEPAASPWSAAVVLVPKKDGKVRFAIDYRRLNAVTVADVYPLPRIDDTLSALRGAKYFSTFDLSSGFWNIPVSEEHRDKTAFLTPGGQYRWTRMPFGLRNAPGVFQRYMDLVLAGVKWNYALVFIDDVLVYSKTWEEHLSHLREVLQRIIDFGLRLKPKKCYFCRKEVLYLGYVVSAQGIRPNPEKVRAIKEFPTLRSASAVKSFLGLTGHYRRFVPKFALRAAPLYALLKKGVPFPQELSPDAAAAVDFLKDSLTRAPILVHPDFTKPFELHTDACPRGLGVILCQRDQENREVVICYLSRSTKGHEKGYGQHDLETLAVVWGILSLRPYLAGQRFKVVTDRNAVKWVMASPDPGRQTRWVIALQGYDFTIHQRPATQQRHVDALSRYPVEESPNPAFSAEVEALPPRVHVPPAVAVASLPVHPGDAPQRANLLLNKSKDEFFAIFRQHQSSDSFCSKVRSARAKALNSAAVRAARLRWDAGDRSAINVGVPGVLKFFVEWAGVLWRVPAGDGYPLHLRGRGPPTGVRWQLVVPATLVTDVIYQVHGLPLLGHLSVNRTIALLRRKFYWKTLVVDVNDFIRACLPCRARKLPRPHSAGLAQYNLNLSPFWRVYIDLTGPFPASSRGNTYILGMMCGFTKWPILVALPDATGVSIAKALYEHLVCVHGLPGAIVSDCAPDLISGAVREMCLRWRLPQIKTSGWQPRANGQIERFFRFLKASMTIFLNEFDDDWEDSMSSIAFAYRVSVNDASGFSPFTLVYGRDPVLPDDLVFGWLPTHNEGPHQYSERLQTTIRRAYALCRERQARAAVRAARRRDHREKRRVSDLRPGDPVLFWEPRYWEYRTGRSHKLSYRWTGPHTILRSASTSYPNVVTLWHAGRGRTGEEVVANVNRLVLFEPWQCTEPSVPFRSAQGREVSPANFEHALVHGALCIIRLEVTPSQALPWCVAKLLRVPSASDSDQSIVVQWFGNAAGNLLTGQLPGWWDPRDKMAYYRQGRLHGSHMPYTNRQDSTRLDLRHVYTAGFELLTDNRVPASVLRYLHHNPMVPWQWAHGRSGSST